VCRLQDIGARIDKNPFFGLAKNRAAALYKVTFV